MARVLIASDHAGVDTKADVAALLRSLGHEVVDLGPASRDAVDYPQFAHLLGHAVVDGQGDWGVLVCGSGVGMSIAANKVAGVRAALANDPYSARMAREHNDANVLVFGARVIGPEMIKEVVRSFAAGAFTPGDDGRHRRRVDAIEPRP
ncbi:MAG: ribose 5-phosphate isomerase B [Myxococcales bacterium]|nr:ribose 5-phosphate isomerase B [Myxococcales bacterium]MCB9519290.1 ribose 5-phosphate isomerase B [Myxococcales bacterium]MCB9530734.1 ribose 5-phosphate isomerase B [Myxococcales bacterium]MCB9533372.1 ribose 5-phosphate isomerase B [Myxococcales bacterium]